MVNDFDWQNRTKLLIGDEGINKLAKSHILVLGLGGVGSFAAELLVRAGIGKITIVDSDSYNFSNINRQIGALRSTIGMLKVDVMEKRLKDINPDIELYKYNVYLKDEAILKILMASSYDYVLDAIDTISPKVYCIYNSIKLGYKVISSMGCGGKFDPSLIRIADISETYECKLAYIIRKKLHALGIYRGFKAVFSIEKVSRDKIYMVHNVRNKKSIVGTISYMPSIFGAFAVSEIIRNILK
jgi:tRNA A37 threonylcarbamoyladenosine dehydratase